MMARRKESNESRTTRYYIRMIKRITKLLIWIFVLFLIVMGIIWVVPRIWHAVFN